MRLMIECPTTGKIVPSGFGAYGSLAAFNPSAYWDNWVRCAACGEMHLVDGTTIKIFPEEPAGF